MNEKEDLSYREKWEAELLHLTTQQIVDTIRARFSKDIGQAVTSKSVIRTFLTEAIIDTDFDCHEIDEDYRKKRVTELSVLTHQQLIDTIKARHVKNTGCDMSDEFIIKSLLIQTVIDTD